MGFVDTTGDFEYTLTRKALRQIKAEAWDAGREYESERAILGWNGSPDDNPYRKDV